MTNKVLNQNRDDIIKQLEKYDILEAFSSESEFNKWILGLSDSAIKNILSLNIKPESIKFDPELLIDKNLLNTTDYGKKVAALIKIKNADGWYHLFDRMLQPEFLHSERFYQDIETLKRAECAQTPLWIIGESTFINSPYHDEDFELLVTAKDTSDKNFDYVVWEAIATIAASADSIYSDYHRQDLQTIIKYGSKALKMFHSYPESSINQLAINPVSLKDQYHLENMEILAQNPKIGNFLYAIMTNENAIKDRNYRRIISEMVENKTNINYVFLVCYYAIGENAINAQNMIVSNPYFKIKTSYDMEELLKKVEERLNVIDGDFKEVTTYKIECDEPQKIEKPSSDKPKSLIKRILKKT